MSAIFYFLTINDIIKEFKMFLVSSTSSNNADFIRSKILT